MGAYRNVFKAGKLEVNKDLMDNKYYWCEDYINMQGPFETVYDALSNFRDIRNKQREMREQNQNLTAEINDFDKEVEAKIISINRNIINVDFVAKRRVN